MPENWLSLCCPWEAELMNPEVSAAWTSPVSPLSGTVWPWACSCDFCRLCILAAPLPVSLLHQVSPFLVTHLQVHLPSLTT